MINLRHIGFILLLVFFLPLTGCTTLGLWDSIGKVSESREPVGILDAALDDKDRIHVVIDYEGRGMAHFFSNLGKSDSKDPQMATRADDAISWPESEAKIQILDSARPTREERASISKGNVGLFLQEVPYHSVVVWNKAGKQTFRIPVMGSIRFARLFWYILGTPITFALDAATSPLQLLSWALSESGQIDH